MIDIAQLAVEMGLDANPTLVRYANLVRIAALNDAAEVCDDEMDRHWSSDKHIACAIGTCAEKIRELIKP